MGEISNNASAIGLSYTVWNICSELINKQFPGPEVVLTLPPDSLPSQVPPLPATPPGHPCRSERIRPSSLLPRISNRIHGLGMFQRLRRPELAPSHHHVCGLAQVLVQPVLVVYIEKPDSRQEFPGRPAHCVAPAQAVAVAQGV